MAPRNYGLITSVDELATFVDRMLTGAGPVGFDIETGYTGEDKDKHSLHPETALIAGISFTDSATDWARYVPLGHDGAENLDNTEAARLFWRLLCTGRGVAHNAAFEMRHLSRWFRETLWNDLEHGETVRNSNGYFPVLACTQVEAYLAAEFQSFGLKSLVDKAFGHKMTELHELFPGLVKKKHKALRFNILELTPQVVEYACEDSLWCLALHERYHATVSKMGLFGVEMGVLQVICEMEDYGVSYDWGLMRRTAEELRGFRDRFNAEIMSELTEMTGVTTAINLASPPQVADILYAKLGMRTRVYTAKTRDLPPEERRMSTGKIALAGLAKQYPVVSKVLQWKEMTRLCGTYLEKYEGLYCYAEDGRTHPHHLSAVVVTGRFAVSDPPYQQSPKVYHFDLVEAKAVHSAHVEAHGSKCRCDDPQYVPPAGTCFTFNFRDAIVAPDDHYILGFDLSQAELRAIAGEAKEEALLRAFACGQDVHTLTASLMLRIPLDQVTKEHRAVGKTMNFALLYGMGVRSLADRLAITVEEAQALYDSYFAVYSNIAAWSAKQVNTGKTQGFVTSKFGRRLPIWEYQSTQRWIYQKGDRACVNYPVQGAATGDFVKIAMVRARNAIRKAGLQDRVHLIMNVHDALEFVVHKSLLTTPQKLRDLVLDVLQPAVIIPVPGWPEMKADWHIAKRWGSPKEIKINSAGFYIGEDRVEEEQAALEQDDETGEEVIIFPEEDVEAVRASIHAAQRDADQRLSLALTDAAVRESVERLQADSGGKHVIIALAEMPDDTGYRRFLAYLDTRPGPNTLTLRTPEGDLDLDLQHGSDLHPGDLATISMMLGTVQITYDISDVDAASLVADLRF